MPDTRARVTTTKVINLDQLDAELGGHGLCGDEDATADGVETTIVVAEDSPVTQQQLDDGVAAHSAVFPPSDEELLVTARTKAESMPASAAKDALLALVSALE